MNNPQAQYDVLSRRINSTTDQQIQDELVEQQERLCAEADEQGIIIALEHSYCSSSLGCSRE